MKKGLNILLNTYWDSKGWKDGSICKEDYMWAKEAGYMFDYPRAIDHKETLGNLHSILNRITSVDVANAFLYSLSSRRLEYRSALGSYWYATAIPAHNVAKVNSCKKCGWHRWEKVPDDNERLSGLNLLNFERYKWGGVRHCTLQYAYFDLEQFLSLPKMLPTSEDMALLYHILHCIGELKSHNKAGKYSEIITKRKIIPCNRSEIEVLLDILGVCGILASQEFPCYDEKFVDVCDRAPLEHTNDFEYPINRWQAKDGINKIRFEKVFGVSFEKIIS